jgi:hypothetical protein
MGKMLVHKPMSPLQLIHQIFWVPWNRYVLSIMIISWKRWAEQVPLSESGRSNARNIESAPRVKSLSGTSPKGI